MEEAALYILINGLDESSSEFNISRDKLEKFISRAEIWKFEFFKQMKDIIVSSVEAMGLKGTSEALSLPDSVVGKISGQNTNSTTIEIRQFVDITEAMRTDSNIQTEEIKKTHNETQTLNQENENFMQNHRKVLQNINIMHELDELISRGLPEREILKRINLPKEVIQNRTKHLQRHIAQYIAQLPQGAQIPAPSGNLQDLPTLPTKRTMNSDRSPIYRNHMNSPAVPQQTVQASPLVTQSNSASGFTSSNNFAFTSKNTRKNIVIATGDDIAPDYSYRPESGTIDIDT